MVKNYIQVINSFSYPNEIQLSEVVYRSTLLQLQLDNCLGEQEMHYNSKYTMLFTIYATISQTFDF